MGIGIVWYPTTLFIGCFTLTLIGDTFVFVCIFMDLVVSVGDLSGVGGRFEE